MDILRRKSEVSTAADVQPAATPFCVPSLGEASPKYQATVERLAEFRAEDERLRIEENVLWEKINLQSTGAPMDANARYVQGLIDGVDPILAGSSDRGRVETINRRRDDLKLAIRELEHRERNERGEASRLACEAVRDEHRRIVAEMVGAMVAVYQPWREYDAFIGKVNAQSVSWGHLGDFTPYFLGNPLDSQSMYAQFMNQCVTSGLLDAGSAPIEVLSGPALELARRARGIVALPAPAPRQPPAREPFDPEAYARLNKRFSFLRIPARRAPAAAE